MSKWIYYRQQRDNIWSWLSWFRQDRDFRQLCGDTWRADARECDSTTVDYK